MIVPRHVSKSPVLFPFSLLPSFLSFPFLIFISPMFFPPLSHFFLSFPFFSCSFPFLTPSFLSFPFSCSRNSPLSPSLSIRFTHHLLLSPFIWLRHLNCLRNFHKMRKERERDKKEREGRGSNEKTVDFNS